MNISPIAFTNEAFFFVQKKVLASTAAQNKKILAIFLAAIACWAISLYAIKRYYFKAEVVNQKKEPEEQIKKVIIPEYGIVKKEYPGIIVEALMRDGEYNGKGTLLFPDGTKCEVLFENNKLNGQGGLTYPSGEKANIYFENVLLNDDGSLSGKVFLTFGKQIEHEKIKFGNFNGAGHITIWLEHGDCEILEGEFKEGQFKGKSLGVGCMGCGMG